MSPARTSWPQDPPSHREDGVQSWEGWDPLPSACAPPSTPLETLSIPGGSQGQCGVCRRVLTDMSAAAFETHESGAQRRPRRPMASAPGLAALSGTGRLDPLILSTQPGEAFLSHSGDSTIRAPSGSRLGRSLATLFFLALESFAERSGVWDRRWGPHGATSTVCPSSAPAPQGSLGEPPLPVGCPCGPLSTSLGGGLLSPPPPASQRKLVLGGVTPFLPLPRSHSEFLS